METRELIYAIDAVTRFIQVAHLAAVNTTQASDVQILLLDALRERINWSDGVRFDDRA